MKKLRIASLLAGAAAVAALALGGTQSVRAAEPIVIGGGSTTGVYYQVALHTCNLINRHMGEKYNCVGRPALGSVFNVNAVNRGLLDFGVAQSDRNWQAANGKADWDGSPVEKLRSVFSVHPETVLLVARADSGIDEVSDLAGKTVNIGNPGSGQRGNAEDVIRLYNIEGIRERGLQQGAASRALIDGNIQAFFYTVGNPAAAIEEPANATDIKLISINSDAIRSYVEERPYYVMTTIPSGTYNGVDEDVETYAVKATVISSSDVSEEEVYDFVKTIFENLDEFKGSHPAFANLTAEEMLQGLSAPLHPGAERYYREKGWLE